MSECPQDEQKAEAAGATPAAECPQSAQPTAGTGAVQDLPAAAAAAAPPEWEAPGRPECEAAAQGVNYDSCDDCPLYERDCEAPRAERERQHQERLAELAARPWCPLQECRCEAKGAPGGCAFWIDRGGWAVGCALSVLAVAFARGLDVSAAVSHE